MKKISVIIFGLICFGMSEVSATPTSVVRKHNGSATGFNDVYQEGNYLLECKNPGEMPCEWTAPPAGGSTYDYELIEAIIDDAFDQGLNQGEGSLNGVYYEWSGTDKYNVEIKFGSDMSDF